MARSPPQSLALLLATGLLHHVARAEHFNYDISDEQYYSMPPLFELDEYEGCVARAQGYCVGSFDLVPPSAAAHSAYSAHSAHSDHDDHSAPASQLYQLMQRYSANWVDRFNHTRVHRGVCLARRCPALASARPSPSPDHWFATCVNASTWSQYGLGARLTHLEYCTAPGPVPAGPAPLTTPERALAGLAAALLALAALATTLDLTLGTHAKKGLSWALAWSLPGSWQALQAPPPAASKHNMQVFDGARVICMLCVMIEHVCWLATLSYTVNPRFIEVNRRASDVMLMTNSTLVVQIFFMMSTFLLAHKLLSERRRRITATAAQPPPPLLATFAETMLNRIIRISPTYWVVVWFAASWWPRLGSGPLWEPLVAAETRVCQQKWWTHLLFLNNVIYPDDKCLIQTWYLAADMQLYALSLLLTLVLLRWRGRGVDRRDGGDGRCGGDGRYRQRGPLVLLALCLMGSLLALGALAYAWRLVPTFIMHRPECIRLAYVGSLSFNVLYQAPLGNVPGALAGLLLAYAHDAARDLRVPLHQYKWFRYGSLAAFPLSLAWAALSPMALPARSPPPRAAAAALAALERPLFAFGIGLSLLGALHGVHSPWSRLMSWRGWAPLARLSFPALLLHMPINKTLVASRLQPKQLDRFTAVFEWCGIAAISYLAAIPLALLVEIPCQRLHRALTDMARARRRAFSSVPSPAPAPHPAENNNNNVAEKTEHT